jgi:hypothetical protein
MLPYLSASACIQECFSCRCQDSRWSERSRHVRDVLEQLPLCRHGDRDVDQSATVSALPFACMPCPALLC